MAKYRVLYEDPNYPDESCKVLIPSDNWLSVAMSGGLPPISVYWELQDDEKKAIDEGKHVDFKHNLSKWRNQFTSVRIGKLTEEEAMEYLIMKDLPKRIWSVKYNRPMFKIVKEKQVPTNRAFREAWEITG